MARYTDFTTKVQRFYADNYRTMPWRENTDTYYILVSELMLQQTQVARVIPKFEAFIARFPNIPTLAEAAQADVLAAWSGLGYNRRAKFLHQAAIIIKEQHASEVPSSHEDLVALPGIGPNTASAIYVYGFNRPAVFIETNIRSVYLHEFFKDQNNIPDYDILPLIASTLDTDNPREWYWALMDYGAYIKKTYPNPNRGSKHYAKQSPFEGSSRQLRGKLLRALLSGETDKSLLQIICNKDSRFEEAIAAMAHEDLIKITKSTITLK